MKAFHYFLFVLFIALPSAAFAQFNIIPASGVVGTCNFATGDIHFDCIPIFIGYLIKFAVGFAGGFFFFGIILGGYKFAIKSASQEKQAGIRQLMYSFIGIIVVVLSYLLVDTILRVLTG